MKDRLNFISKKLNKNSLDDIAQRNMSKIIDMRRGLTLGNKDEQDSTPKYWGWSMKIVKKP